ncbi:Type I restriction-modification system methyltransferase and restriction endonuclease [Methanonatronarchaeum thermophilum]|uniref:site-specific DNA-methyltransferase (adenine-specific) n=1 Tax=Methanonatronarchaeum thermophilum TaxID=1927129 RepID=A0A1Y3GCX2_9EURY|nr:class I SAM-dependent DNA methyltransferase [Methanonatronarchaeum thermophilum]OUJ18044.1 Type I restriction-modification system methyltransferase and restriction endonuclease [Methanonatronarchaeum thermophilum]
MAKLQNNADSYVDLDTLESHLWESADILRGSIDSSDYKNYIFGLLFLKRISDRFEEEVEELVNERGLDEQIARNDPDFHDFYIPEKGHWNHIKKQSQDIGSTLNKALEAIEDENDEIEERVLTSIDFNDKDRLPDDVLEELVNHFSKLNFKNENLEDADIFGRAYEYLIRQFADDSGKKGGEFYTPREVVKLLIRILDPEPGMRVYDPCCGSGGMLIYSAKHIRNNNGGRMQDITLYGQEKNLNTWAIAEINMLLHNLPDAKIAKGNTMRNPKFLDDGNLKQFDIVLANPMWNQKKWSKEYLKENNPHNRMQYGFPPKNKADWAWIQHMLASLNKNGRIGVILDNGVLSRSRSEKKIRKSILQDDLIEAVIALPENLFYNTGSPGTILIITKTNPKNLKTKSYSFTQRSKN